jgi:PKHD-type hydroxylase
MARYFVIDDFVDERAVADLLRQIRASPTSDGAATATGIARDIKRNKQITNSDNKRLVDRIEEIISNSADFRNLTMYRYLLPVIVNKYSEGMAYDAHSDAPFIDGIRVDISFTLFLSDPDSYDGGELVIEAETGEQSFKLPSGTMLIYPNGNLHRVNLVTRGTRFAAIGWAQSQIRDPAKREILHDIQQVRAEYLRQLGHDRSADILSKVGFNLVRMWAD